MERSIREIGSEFWQVETCIKSNSLFPESISWYLSGRSALRAIITQIKEKEEVHTVALPSWCCDSMITPFLEEGITVSFYPVFFQNGALVQDIDIAKHADILFVMDYFGYARNATFDFHGTVIRDQTHSILTKEYKDADYYFGSLRKWSGFLTGGFAWGTLQKSTTTVNSYYISLRKEAMRQKALYISQKSAEKNYLSIFSEAENCLEMREIGEADKDDIERAKYFDVDFVKTRRRQNAALLLDAFSDIAVFPHLNPNDCPLFVPILVPGGQRDALRRHLIAHEIYCPIHWPVSPYHKLNDTTAALYSNELSLICDQRYGEEDMNRIISAIKKFKRS